MLGFLKNLLHKGAEEKSARAETPKSDPKAAPPATAAPPVAVAPPSGPTIQVPLRAVAAKFPDSLKAQAGKFGKDHSVTLPLSHVIPQLAAGAVKISVAEMQAWSTPGALHDFQADPQTLIEIPLSEILSQISPQQLPKRHAQRKVAAPEDIGPIFGPKGEPYAEPKKASPAAPAPVAAPPPAEVAPPSPPAQPVISLAPPAPAIVEQKPISMPAPKLAEPIGSIKADLPPPPPAPVPAPPKPQPPAPPAPAQPIALAVQSPQPGGQTLSLSVRSLLASASEATKAQLGGLEAATIEAPIAAVEEGLKKGRVAAPWRQLKQWIKPAPAAAPAGVNDDTSIELPLAVITPLFLALKRPGKQQKKYAVAENIPDLFHGTTRLPIPESVPPAPPPSPAPVTPPAVSAAVEAPPATAPIPVAPVPAPAPVAAPQPALATAPAQKPLLSFGEIFGQPEKKDWTPLEIVQRAGNLRGVAGAMIGTSDGMLIAAQLPPEVVGETVAAFVPQMYTRIMQYTSELKIGSASNLAVMVENVPLQIFKTGQTYFMALGKAGENLPRAQLLAIAAQLAYLSTR